MGLESYLQQDVRVLTGRITYDGVPCCDYDANLVAEMLCLRVPLVLDLFEDERSALGYRRALLSLQTIDAKSYFQDVKAIYKALTAEEFLNTGNWLDFKHQVSRLPLWLVTPLLRHLPDGAVTAKAFYKAMQWARFDSHMSFRGTPSDPELVDYLNNEFRLRHDPHDEPLYEALNEIIKEWCESFPDEATPFSGVHSSGAVTGIRRKDASMRSKTLSLRMSEKSRKYIQYRTGWDISPLQLAQIGDDGNFRYSEFVPAADDDPVRVIPVPKDPSKKRIVTPEGPMQMFLQGDAAHMIYPWISKFHWGNLYDQSHNRQICIRASRTGEYTTVDLSNASDNVRHSSMRILLRGTPLWPLYDLSRSERAKVRFSQSDVVNVTLEKASPMGSKLCFPDMTVVLASACELSVRIEKGRKSKGGDFWVYGDDIIIRSDCYYRLRLILALMRYVVNDDKTFTEKGALIFREACGMFALNGTDVTPFQVSRKYAGVFNVLHTTKYHKEVRMMLPSAAPTLGLIDMLNRLMVQGLVNTRRSLLHLLSSEKWMKRIWRVRLQDYQSDNSRIVRGLPPVSYCPAPTLITFDHVDANWQLPPKGRDTVVFPDGRRVDVTSPDVKSGGWLTVHASPRESSMDSIDFFGWECVRAAEKAQPGYHVMMVAGKCVIIPRAEYTLVDPSSLRGPGRLVYSSPGKLRWRLVR